VTHPGLFQLKEEQDALVITPLLDMGEFNSDQIKEEGAALLKQVDEIPAANFVIDFAKTDYFVSDALGLFVHLWRKAAQRGGRIAFCNVHPYGAEVLERAKFDHLGPICATRSDALATMTS
jgi:anti-anti-sigma factor